MKDVDFDKVNRYLTEKATICPKEMKKEEKPYKKVQKDEMEDEKEEDEVVEMKKVKASIKALKKIKDALEKKGEDKFVADLVKVLEYLGEEESEKEDEDKED